METVHREDERRLSDETGNEETSLMTPMKKTVLGRPREDERIEDKLGCSPKQCCLGLINFPITLLQTYYTYVI